MQSPSAIVCSVRIGIPAHYPEAPGFSTLEIDYAGLASWPGPQGSGELPAGGEGAESLSRLAGAVRADADFSVIAPPSLCAVQLRPDPLVLAQFRSALGALVSARRLFAVLLSFPLSFSYGTAERRHLDRLAKDLADFPLVVEFRSAEWFSSRVLENLKRRNVGLCVSDFPRLPGYPPPSDLVTAGCACMRLHGRGPERPDAVDQERDGAEYLYAEHELEALAIRVAAMARQAGRLRVYAVTNRASARLNAAGLARFAREAGLAMES
jgi:uncharacterized protein YecE (DUF72 family)